MIWLTCFIFKVLMVNKTHRKLNATCFEHVTFQVLKVQIMSSKTIKKIRIRFLIFHMVQRKWNSLGRNSDAHRQTLKVHKTWLELDRIRIFIISLKSFTKPEQAPSLMLHLQGLFGRPGDYMYSYFVDPPLLLFGWQMLRLPRYHSEQWCLRHLQRTAQHRHLQRCYQGRESVRILFLLMPLMKCWTSRYRLDCPSVAHPLQQPLHSQIIANRPLQHMSVDHAVHRRAGYDHMSYYVIWQWRTDYIAD